MSGTRGLQSTAAPPRTPGIPESAAFHLLSDFLGVNTRVDRASIDDQEMAWSDNLMPIGKGQLRALYDVGPPLYIAPGGTSIVAHGWFILSDGVSYCLVFLSDGRADKVRQSDGAIFAVASAGTFQPSAGTVPAFAQYGNQYVLIVTDQTNGYFIYDGTFLYQAGTVSPSASLTDGGNDYTSAPSVTVNTTGSGFGAHFSATVADGSVVLLTCTNPGTGFQTGDLVWPTFSGGGAGTSPIANASLANGVITSVALSAGGSGWQSSSGVQQPPSVSISDPTGSGAAVQVNGMQGGIVTSLQILNGGRNYSNPTVTFQSPTSGQVSPQASAYTSDGVVVGVNLVSGGGGLVGEVTAKMLDPDGSGAAFTVSTYNGAVTDVQINGGGLEGGSGYTKTPIVFSGGGLASAELELMPAQVNGTSNETYQTRAWITGGSGSGTANQHSLTFFTAPESTTDFAASSGGGVFPSTDSFLKRQYTAIKQSLGYIYLLGDSSVNYISGVQTQGNPPTTTFSNLNIDPTIGTVWPESVVVFGTSVMFANVYGIHAIIGGSVRKVSEPMDGLFATAPALGGFRPSSALHTLYGKHIYVFSYKTANPYTGAVEYSMMCWDGQRWWTYTPSVNIISVSTLEIQSDITAWGTDGSKIYPLFAVAGPIQKTLKGKLYTSPSIIQQKRGWGVYLLFGAYQASGAVEFAGQIDTDGNNSAGLTFDTLNGSPNGLPDPTIRWARSLGAQGSGYGVGLTLTSVSPDFVLYQALLVAQDYATRT